VSESSTRVSEPTERFASDRIVAISDGIFAVALTLLVLDVKLPSGPVSTLASALRAGAGHFGIFALSFSIVAYYWTVHHLAFVYVRSGDRALMWLNLGFLFTIVVLPFSAGVLGEYPLEPLALAIYGVNIAACSLTLAAVWRHALQANLIERPHAAQLRYIAWRFALSAAAGLGGAALGFVIPALSLALFVASPVASALTSRSLPNPKSRRGGARPSA
jgi:uncharacterized membrane protein